MFHDIDDLLHLGGARPDLPLTSLVFKSRGVILPNPSSNSPPPTSSTFMAAPPELLREGNSPSFFHLKNPFFFSNCILSICACMASQRPWRRFTSPLSRLISACWAVTSLFERHRAGGSSAAPGLRVPLKEPLQSMWWLSLLCSEKRTWITALMGNRSFWAAWKDASAESFRLSISLHSAFLSCFDKFGCACASNSNME